MADRAQNLGFISLCHQVKLYPKQRDPEVKAREAAEKELRRLRMVDRSEQAEIDRICSKLRSRPRKPKDILKIINGPSRQYAKQLFDADRDRWGSAGSSK